MNIALNNVNAIDARAFAFKTIDRLDNYQQCDHNKVQGFGVKHGEQTKIQGSCAVVVMHCEAYVFAILQLDF
jgi:hypothetical protein